jgi:hypothetical protein
MDKVKPGERPLELWLSRYTGPYIISEKLDIDEGWLDGKKTFVVANKDKKEEFEASDEKEALQLAAKKWNLPSVEGLNAAAKANDTTVTTANTSPASDEDDQKASAIDRATKGSENRLKAGKVGGIVGTAGKLVGGALGLSEEDNVVPFKKKQDDEDFDDDDWIPSIEDFEQEEKHRNRKRTPANDVNEMDKSPEANPYSGQGHRKGDDHAGKPQHTAKIMAAKQAVKMARKALDKAFKGEVDENFISMAPQAVAEKEMDSTTKSLAVPADKMLEAPGAETLSHNQSTEKSNLKAFDLEEEMDEGLDANQKRVGQLGPTEKVKNNNIGKLVGASESTEIDPELARIIEMARFKR